MREANIDEQRRKAIREDRIFLSIISIGTVTIFSVLALAVRGLLAWVGVAVALGISLQVALIIAIGFAFLVSVIFALIAGDGTAGELPILVLSFIFLSLGSFVALVIIF